MSMKTKHRLKTLTIAAIFSLGLTLSLAQSAMACSGGRAILTFPFWYEGVLDANCQLPEGANEAKMVTKVILNIADIVLQSVAYISVIFVIIGGFKYMTALGDQGAVAGAKKTITNAVTGLVIGALASAIINLVFKIFLG